MDPTFGQLVRAKRNELKWSQQKLGEQVGAHAMTIEKIESGKIKFSRYRDRLVHVLGLPSPTAVDLPQVATNLNLNIGPRDLPHFYAQDSTKGGFPTMLLRLPIVDQIARPFFLEGVSEAYAVAVSNDMMAPLYKWGDTIFVNPRLPPEPGKDVVIRASDKADETDVIIGELESVSKDKWSLVQHSTGKKIGVPRELFPVLHRIVGKMNR